MGYFTDCDFDSSEDLLDAVQEVVERHVQGMRSVQASELGLDSRCGMVWVDEDCVVAYKGSRIDYYGGFEYIKDDDRREMGEYVFYMSTSSRVQDCLECLMEKDGLCESDGQPTEQEERSICAEAGLTR